MEDTRREWSGRSRRLPVGAEVDGRGGVDFRVWAPGRGVVLELDTDEGRRVLPLEPEEGGYRSGSVPNLPAGVRYRFRLDDGPPCPDPASRHQPEGPDGPSAVVDPGAFRWTDDAWGGIPEAPGPVVYELHVGTFTSEGTWASAADRLPRLHELGITVIEMMPVADFPGRFGWGYDGVYPFAPYHGYGEPDDLRRFVDEAHRVGLAVILDVVYNHVGADGNRFGAFSPDFLSRTHTTDWGDAFNYDGPGSEQVRAFVLANVRHWVEEYHLDGFRFDATQDIRDGSPTHILAELAQEARAVAGGRRLLLLAENEPQDVRLVTPVEDGGFGLDGMANDDFHHAMAVALTGRREGYYTNYRGSPQELVSSLKRGFLYQGQWYPWQQDRRGTPTREIPPRAMVHYLESHDQVANRPGGARLHSITARGRWRAAVAVQLLGPQTPMLFQGQEFASSAPFLYFADNRPDAARMAREGRAEFMSQFRDQATPEGQASLAEPSDPATFRSSTLEWREWDEHPWAVALHRDLLRLRTDDSTFSGRRATSLDGAVLVDEAFVIRWLGASGAGEDDRLLLVNLGRDLRMRAAPEPLLAPPPPFVGWSLCWSSEDPRYGGSGTPPVEMEGWNLPAGSALVMAPRMEERR